MKNSKHELSWKKKRELETSIIDFKVWLRNTKKLRLEVRRIEGPVECSLGFSDHAYFSEGTSGHGPVFNRHFCGDERKRADIRVPSGSAAEGLLARTALTVAAIDRIGRVANFRVSLDFINPDFGYLLPMTRGSDEIAFKLRH